MKVRCSMVISPNGYISRPDGTEDWIDDVSWNDFVAMEEKYRNLIVGRTTYDVVHELDEIQIEHKVVVTTDKNLQPRSGYVVVRSPEEAVTYLEKQGLKDLLLIGGGHINASFAKAGLIDELEVFIEPYVIGKGKQVFSVGDFEFSLELLEVEKLSKDRVRLLYKVSK